MRALQKLSAGQNSTRKLLDRYDYQLVRTRYRCDEHSHKRFKTVELIVEESARPAPPIKPEKLIGGAC